jgi:hypothetical protein
MRHCCKSPLVPPLGYDVVSLWDVSACICCFLSDQRRQPLSEGTYMDDAWARRVLSGTLQGANGQRRLDNYLDD